MLKFLTHKLRTHSLNENQDKTDDDHDSGTESDDEFQDDTSSAIAQSRIEDDCPVGFGSRRVEEQDTENKWRDVFLNNDQHSSEEELEVINSPKMVASQGCRPATAPEKRKWSEVSQAHCCRQVALTAASCSAPVSRAGKQEPGSSDEEVQGLLRGEASQPPVQFCTSPPVDAHKPGRSLSPPPKLFHAGSSRDPRPRPRSRPRTHLENPSETSLSACSPRKRHRPPHRQPRPCLDFEKMQQLKARAVTAWRHSGELSVFCW